MNNSEVRFFEAIKLYNDEFYWDSIEAFQQSLSDGLEDRYVDDCFMNIAVCYMKLKLFNEAEEFFLKAIEAGMSSDDNIDFEGPIYGKTSDRAMLGLVRISLVRDDINQAQKFLKKLSSSDSYIEINDEKIPMKEICKAEIEKYKKSKE